jgi:hypothetical protein
MGLFQHKHSKSLSDEAMDEVELLFDDDFREELRAHGRTYFERVVNENAALFKQDLDATVAHINTELRQHVARQLDLQFADIKKVNEELREHIMAQLDMQLAEYSKTMKQAQDAALESLEQRAKSLEAQYAELRTSLEKSIAHQDALLTNSVTESASRLNSMKGVQDTAIQSLADGVKLMQEHNQQMSEMLQEGIAKQQDMMIGAFEQNMANVIEHYLLGALGDQYDMKAQLPMIIKQMEENKQAMTDDMKL